VAVKLGYKNVFRDPKGFPQWRTQGLPTAKAPEGLTEFAKTHKTYGPLHGWGMIWTLLGIFAGGIALNLTPCVYPLIPITVSYFGGRTAKGKGTLLANGSCYIGGLALTNSSLGVAAALTGGLMGAMLQNPLVLAVVATVLLIFATSLFGFWELRLPYSLTQAASKSYTGYFGSFFMGVTLGVVAAPCIGPFVLGLLTWVASMGNPWLGFLIFFTLSIGLGLPLFFLAIFSGQIEKLPRSGEWMLWVQKLMGWVLVGMAAYFIQPLLSKSLEVLLLAAIALIGGLHLGWIDRSEAGFRAFEWIRTGAGLTGLVMATLIIGSWAIQGPGVTWQPYSDENLSEAHRLKRPVIIDFYADWCAPCRELEEVTFHNSEIVEQAKRYFTMIKVDLTRKDNPDHERLLSQYNIKGVPTVLFLDRNGRERADLRLVDFLPAEQFLIRMAALRETAESTVQ
jgi:thiol:disulfide interchange protein DsbD